MNVQEASFRQRSEDREATLLDRGLTFTERTTTVAAAAAAENGATADELRRALQEVVAAKTGYPI